jgi:hypothetical protein
MLRPGVGSRMKIVMTKGHLLPHCQAVPLLPGVSILSHLSLLCAPL